MPSAGALSSEGSGDLAAVGSDSDDPSGLSVGEVGASVPEPGREGLRELAIVDSVADAALLDEVEVVLLASSWGADAGPNGASSGERCGDAVPVSADSRAPGSGRPRFPARRRMPPAALGLKKNL